MRGMKKILALLCACVLLCVLAACSAEEVQTGSSADAQMQTQSAADPSAQEESAAASSELSEMQTESSIPKEENMLPISIAISVGEKTFTATLYDNPAAKALTEFLPMTLDMSELNGNEKYFYLEHTLPTDASKPSGIHAGDLMLYGNNCLVLFYESFSTSYSYTPLGRIDDPEGLAAALGSGSVRVAFQKG